MSESESPPSIESDSIIDESDSDGPRLGKAWV